MTRHGHGHINIQLQLLPLNLLINVELIRRLSIQVLSEIIQHEQEDDRPEDSGEDPTATTRGGVRRLDFGKGVECLDGRDLV
jgi:hypothetical protein